MSHLSEEQLILRYYGEDEDDAGSERHIRDCPECRALYGSIQRLLNGMDAFPTPERGGDYGAQVWARLEGRLSSRPRLWSWTPFLRWATAAVAVAGLLVAAFFAGRLYPGGEAAREANAEARQRVLLVALDDYLERSRMVLIELANAEPEPALDISAEQARAADLVSESRLYRQTAMHAGDTGMASVLEDLERALVEISHEPSRLSPERLEELRARLNQQGILLKIRVLGSSVRREKEPADPGAREL
jgi:hypothetical protein